MNTDTRSYAVLLSLAEGDTPMTVKEIWEAMPEERRPDSGADDRPWARITTDTSRLYGEHLVDRQKRDVKGKPYEYWLAGKGREALEENDDFNSADDGETAEAVMVAGEDGGFLGTDVEIRDQDELNDVLVGICDSLMEVRETVDHLQEDAASDQEVEAVREDARKAQGAVDRLRNEIGALREDVQSLPVEMGSGEFSPYVQRLQQLQDDGWKLREAEVDKSYTYDKVEIRVVAEDK